MQTRDLQYSLTFAKKQALTLHPKLKKMSEKIQPREVETAGFRLQRRAEITVQCIHKTPQTAAKKKKDTPKTTASSVCQHLHRLKQLIRRVLGFWRNSLAVNLSDREGVVLQILPWDSYVLVLFMNTGCCCDNGTLTSDKTKKEKEKKENPPHCWQCFCLPACWNCVFFLWVLTPHSQTLCSFLLLLLLLNQSALLSHSTECGWWSQSGCYHSRSTDNGTDAAPFVHNKFTCAAENCYRFSVPGRKDRKLLGKSDKPIFIMESTVTPSEWMWNKYLLP